MKVMMARGAKNHFGEFLDIAQREPFSRKSMHRELELIRHLRNRIAHHEPIIRTDLPLHHERILRMIRWFSDEFADWVASHSRFPDVWQSPDNPFLTDNKTSEL